ncbi:hypothetical protein NFI96_000291, partial [Prochilodus magdalenae]
IHTLQWMTGCELDDDGTKRGYSRFGYDGEDFLSLDVNTLTWTPANDVAVIINQELDQTKTVASEKYFLETECIEWLQTYVDYGKETLNRTVPPEVSLFQKNSSVVCHATGFFPRPVMISWQKNGEDLYEDVELGKTLPNLDDTFQKRSILTVSPEELDKHNYTCIIQHSRLEKAMVLQVNKSRGSPGVLIGIIIGAAVFTVDQVVFWINHNNLEHSNTAKTVEMTVDFEKPSRPSSTDLDRTVMVVESYKFLGMIITKDLKWDYNISSIIKKAQQRMCFLSQLRKFNQSQGLMRHQNTFLLSELCEADNLPFDLSVNFRSSEKQIRTVRLFEMKFQQNNL